MTDLLLGIDVGTSSVKAVATDPTGRRVADAMIRYATESDGAAAEQNAHDWWEAVCAATRQVVDGQQVLGVAVTSQAPTFVPVDRDGEPTYAALTWLDRRAQGEAQRIAQIAPDSRNGADAFFGTAKLPWLAAHRPQELAAAEYVLSANGFIVRRLTGRSVLDDTTAALMQGFDDDADDFSPALRAAEPSLRYLAPIVPASQIVGTITEAAALATGITQGAPVIAGGIDSIGSAIEAGVLDASDPLVDMTGFSSVTILAVPRGTRIPGFIHTRHCVPGVDLLITAQVTAGATVDWVNGLDGTTDLRDDDELLSRDRPSRVTMITSLAGERTPTWNARSRGIIDGIDLATDGAELLLAAMEGNGRALAHDIATIRSAGFGIDRMISTGGGSASRAWLQIKSDILGIPVIKPVSGHGAAHGAAIMAGMTLGRIEDLAAVRELAADVEAEYRPDPARTAAYEETAMRYARLAALNVDR